MRTPSNAARAFALLATLNDSAYRRRQQFHDTLKANMGGFRANTMPGPHRGGGSPSDPTGAQAIDPRSDPARFDEAESARDLLQAAKLLVELDATISTTLQIDPLQALPRLGSLRELRSMADTESALDTVGYVIERDRELWPEFHYTAGDTLDRSEAYNDLRQAVDLLGAVDTVMCRWLGGDPYRVHCQNKLGCPDRNPPKIDQLRCDACGKHLQRYGEERPRHETLPRTAPVEPPAGPGGSVGGDPPIEGVETSTGPHSAPNDASFVFGAWLAAHPATEGAA